jgi:hypothetical protein
MVNHFEYPQPAVWYLSELRTDARGRLRVADTRPIPAAEVGGLWHTRSGAATPWGTHLSGEAAPPDCRAYDDTLRACRAGPDAARTSCGLKAAESDAASIAEFARFYGLYPGAAKWGLKGLDIFESQPALDAFVSRFRCYNYGASPEVAVLPGGQTRLVKWRTLGRVSHGACVFFSGGKYFCVIICHSVCFTNLKPTHHHHPHHLQTANKQKTPSSWPTTAPSI